MSFLTCNSQEICVEEVHFKMLIETEEQAMILSETFLLKAEQIRQWLLPNIFRETLVADAAPQ